MTANSKPPSLSLIEGGSAKENIQLISGITMSKKVIKRNGRQVEVRKFKFDYN